MKQIITFLTVFLLFTGCNSDIENNNKGDENDKKDLSSQSPVDFTLIAQKDLSPSEQEQIPKANLVIKDTESWNSFISKITVNNNETKYFTETNIDFTKYQIIAVVDQVRYSGGYSIDITTIKETDNNIIVKVENLKKGNLTSIVTQPYHIVKIATTGKIVVFE